jgi:hypothetical protein
MRIKPPHVPSITLSDIALSAVESNPELISRIFNLLDCTKCERRSTLLAGLYDIDAARTAGRNVLLFDDLFRSGATMNAITDVLMRDGKAASVRALTITRTRINR